MRTTLFTVATAVVVAGMLATPASAEGLLTQPRCTDVSTKTTVFRPGGVPLLDWRENLEFDGRGMLWVSHLMNNQVEGYTPDGKQVATVAVPGPGGIRRGPDGQMYVNYGINIGSTDAGIMRFDPASAAPKPAKVVGGLSGINGLAIDPAGNFYLGREVAPTILKLRPDGTEDTAWTAAATVFGTNGLTIGGGTLYGTVLLDLNASVVRVPLQNPGGHSVLSKLSPLPKLTKGLDDLELVDGKLLVTAFLTGELLRVDPASGNACVLAAGLQTPTSVRIPAGFGQYDDGQNVFVSEASGRVVRVTITPR